MVISAYYYLASVFWYIVLVAYQIMTLISILSVAISPCHTKEHNSSVLKLTHILFCVTQTSQMDFFTEYGEGNRYKIEEVIGKGSYGVVCSALDTHTGEKVAIKKINDIFEHVSDATRILREIDHRHSMPWCPPHNK